MTGASEVRYRCPCLIKPKMAEQRLWTEAGSLALSGYASAEGCRGTSRHQGCADQTDSRPELMVESPVQLSGGSGFATKTSPRPKRRWSGPVLAGLSASLASARDVVLHVAEIPVHGGSRQQMTDEILQHGHTRGSLSTRCRMR